MTDPAPAGNRTPHLRALLVVGAAGLCYAAVVLGCVVIDPFPGKFEKFPDFGNTVFERAGMVVLAVLAGLVCWIIVATDRLRQTRAADEPVRVILCIVSLLSASGPVMYLAALLLHTELTGMGAPPSVDKKLDLVYQLVVLSWLVAVVVFTSTALLARAARDPRHAHRRRQAGHTVLIAVLLLPLGWPAVLGLVRAVPVDLLACAATTGLAVWAVHGMQRHRRMPFRAVAGGFGWGAFVAVGLGIVHGEIATWFAPGIVRYLEGIRLVYLSLAPAVSEEIAKAAGVVVIALLAQRWFDNVATGVVLGAAVGLGFNFVESVLYMTTGGPEFQHWTRQSVWIMAAHTAFTALSGAGIGIAWRARSRRTRRLAVAAGLGAAICAHLANNYLGGRMGWWTGLSDDPWIGALLLVPGMLMMLQLPFVVGYVVLLRRGLREQYDVLRAEVPAEARAGHGAVTADEIDELLNPARRFRRHVDAFLRGGPAGYRRSARRHAAQLDLAMARWHRRAGHPWPRAADVESARDRVLVLKAVAG